MSNIIPAEIIERKIFLIRGNKVMLDRDLAELYGVPTKVLNQAVKRNIKRFPGDFMFQLTQIEKDEVVANCDYLRALRFSPQFVIRSRSQIVTLKRGQNIKYLPYVFTEQGVAMLSSVLNSERAILVNIQIMRAFTKLREMLLTHKDLAKKIEEMERKYDQQFKVVFDAIKQLLTPSEKPKRRIGFHT